MQSAGPHHYPAGGPAIRHAELDSILSLADSKLLTTLPLLEIATSTIYALLNLKSVRILFLIFRLQESIKIENRIGHWRDLSSFEFTNLKSFRILETETKLLIGCIKNPVGKAYQWQEHEESELDRVHILHEKNSNIAHKNRIGIA